jgi:hypothetical protein
MIEYKIIQAKSLINEEQCKDLSNEGWELISIVPVNNWASVGDMTYYFYFKRYVLSESK